MRVTGIFTQTVCLNFALGQGLYTISEAARLIGEPVQRVRAWLKNYWAEEGYGKLGDVPTLNFSTLIELKTFVQLRVAGVSARDIQRARKELQLIVDDEHPFANRAVLEGLATDEKKKVSIRLDENYLSLDGKRQFQLGIIEEFMDNLDFGDNGQARRYTPPKGNGSIVLDPKINFGAPSVAGTRIEASVLHGMRMAGDSVQLLASLYGLTRKQVEDAINFCMAA